MPVLLLAVGAAAAADHERIHDGVLLDAASGHRTRYTVVLPDDNRATGGAVPCVLLLHGSGRHCRTLIEAPQTRELLLGAPFATVMPDGGGGWWVDRGESPASRCESRARAVMREAESRFGIGGTRSLRGICGWSMGGFGCARLAAGTPELFCAAAPMIGLLDFPNASLPPAQNHSIPAVLEPEPERWNPMLLAPRLEEMALLLITGERAFDRQMNENFAARLHELGVPHELRILPGHGHTFPCVEACLREVVPFLARAFAAAAAAGTPPAERTAE